MTEMTLKEAIAGLKELKLCIIGSGKRIWIDREACEVIDTAVKELEKPTYTAEDMNDFAEWTAFMQWIYDQTDKVWFQKHSSKTKTTVQLREMWENERMAK